MLEYNLRHAVYRDGIEAHLNKMSENGWQLVNVLTRTSSDIVDILMCRVVPGRGAGEQEPQAMAMRG